VTSVTTPKGTHIVNSLNAFSSATVETMTSSKSVGCAACRDSPGRCDDAKRKPGGFDFAKPLEKWELSECWGLLRRRLEAHDPRHGTRSYIQVLRLLEKFSLPQLTAAVEYALDIDVIDAASIRTIAEHRADRPVPLFPLDGRPHLAHVHVETTDVSSYQTLLSDSAAIEE
jgi:hypothetical protein